MAAHATRAGTATLVPSTGGDERRRGSGRRDLIEQVGALFSDASAGAAGPGSAGVEVELICVEGRPPRPVPAARLGELLAAADPTLAAEACLSFEPGGQLELSPPPQPSTAALLTRVDALLARVDRALAAGSVVAVSSGINPWHDADSVGLHLDAERYLVMQQHFDRLGPAGRDMMRLTASLQVCVERQPGAAGVEQWVLANRMGPALSAAFANSGAVRGAPSGWSSSRCHLWQELDASRTGFDAGQVDAADPAAAYAAFAAGAYAMPLQRDGELPPPCSRFAAWIDGGAARPDAADVTHHLSTLFPPVRPRGYLEVRYLDAPPRRWLAAPLLAVQVLLGDARAREAALAALEPADRGAMLALWQAAAHQGVSNPWLRHEARTLADIAIAAARRLPRDAAPPAALTALRRWRTSFLDAARCWSDDQVERITGPDAEDPGAWT
jgi:glutamate--cysteine ligase